MAAPTAVPTSPDDNIAAQGYSIGMSIRREADGFQRGDRYPTSGCGGHRPGPRPRG
jgi:hypothetical protein